jgi:hypothetical protein
VGRIFGPLFAKREFTTPRKLPPSAFKPGRAYYILASITVAILLIAGLILARAPH